MIGRFRSYLTELFAGSVILNVLIFMYIMTARTYYDIASPERRRSSSSSSSSRVSRNLLSDTGRTTTPASLPLIYAITPTFKRMTQKADLTRLSHTMMHVPHLHWIVVEDSNGTSALVETVLRRSGVPHTLLYAYKDDEIKAKYEQKKKLAGKGFIQRNEALSWIRNKYAFEDSPDDGGVIYFMDDDNTYDLRLFEQMRAVHRIAVAPVAFVGGLRIEKPLVRDRKVVGFDNQWAKSRQFGTDMAGIAINLGYFLNHTNAEFPLNSPAGHFENRFLMTFNITKSELEVFGADMTDYGEREVLVWHTKTRTPGLGSEEKYYNRTGHSSNFGWEY